MGKWVNCFFFRLYSKNTTQWTWWRTRLLRIPLSKSREVVKEADPEQEQGHEGGMVAMPAEREAEDREALVQQEDQEAPRVVEGVD